MLKETQGCFYTKDSQSFVKSKENPSVFLKVNLHTRINKVNERPNFVQESPNAQEKTQRKKQEKNSKEDLLEKLQEERRENLERRKRLSQVLQEVTEKIQTLQSKRKDAASSLISEKEKLRKTIGYYEYQEQRKKLDEVPSFEKRKTKE